MSPIRRAAGDVALRAQYVGEVLDVLYPPPASGTGLRTEFVVVPNARRPRLLVPVGSRQVAAAAVRRYAQPAARTARFKRDLAALALRTGVDRALLRDRITVTRSVGADTFEHYLRRVLDWDVTFSVHIGPARANRKPVVQLLSTGGETIGFAKLGTNPLTRRLVRSETTALTALRHARLSTVDTPRVVHAGRWRGHEVLVQEALPAWQSRHPAGLRLPAAMREVASCFGLTRTTLSASRYAVTLRKTLAAVNSGELHDATDGLLTRRGDTALEFGAWHGDWAPWNMAALAGSLLVWDWERFTPGVPMGFDALHHALHVRLERGKPARAAVSDVVSRAPELLAPFDVAPDAARVTALLYLVDLASRYLIDKQAEAGARLGVLGTWLLPVLLQRLAEL
jgi:hypothetical protein